MVTGEVIPSGSTERLTECLKQIVANLQEDIDESRAIDAAAANDQEDED